MVECEAELQAGPACSPSRGTAHTLVGPMSRTKPFSALRREDPPRFSGQGTMPHRLLSCLSRVRLALCWGHSRGKKPRPPVPVPAIWEAMRQGSQAGQPRAGWALPPLPIHATTSWSHLLPGSDQGSMELRPPSFPEQPQEARGWRASGAPSLQEGGAEKQQRGRKQSGHRQKDRLQTSVPRQWPGSCWTQCSRPGRAPIARFTSLVLAHSQNEMLHTRAQCPGSASPRPVTATAHPG